MSIKRDPEIRRRVFWIVEDGVKPGPGPGPTVVKVTLVYEGSKLSHLELGEPDSANRGFIRLTNVEALQLRDLLDDELPE